MPKIKQNLRYHCGSYALAHQRALLNKNALALMQYFEVITHKSNLKLKIEGQIFELDKSVDCKKVIRKKTVWCRL